MRAASWGTFWEPVYDKKVSRPRSRWLPTVANVGKRLVNRWDGGPLPAASTDWLGI